MDSGSCNEGAGHYGSQTEHRFHRWCDGHADSIRLECPKPHVNGFVNAISRSANHRQPKRSNVTTGNASRVDLANSARTDQDPPKVKRLHAEIPAARTTRQISRWSMRRGMSIAGWYSREALSLEPAIGVRLKEGPLVTQ